MAVTFLDQLSEADRAHLLAVARPRHYERHEVVFWEGEYGETLHIISRGRVAVQRTTPEGERATLAVFGRGAFFGELALVGAGERRTATVVALEECETLAVQRRYFDELRHKRPSVDRFLVQVLAAQVTRTSELLLEALFVTAEVRVLRRVRALAEEYGQGRAGVVIPLTQEDIASMAGVARPTCNRVLRGAEEAGLLRMSRARLEVLDPVGLARHADAGWVDGDARPPPEKKFGVVSPP